MRSGSIYPGSRFSIRAAFFLLLLVFGIVSPGLAGEETSNPSPLTLEDAIRTALEKNPRISAARFQLDASAARITQARSGLYPRIDFSESYSRTNNPALVFSTRLNQEQITTQDFDPSSLNDPSSIQNFASVLSLSMPIYEAGQVRIGVDQARLGQESATLSADRVRQEVISTVVASYIGVLLLQDQLEVIRQTLESAKANRKIIQSRVQSGLAVKSDFLRAQVRVAELEQEQLNARSQVDVARATLNAAMGISTDEARHPIPFKREETKPDNLEKWLQVAFQNRPDLKEMRLQELSAEQEVKKAKMAHLPGLFLTGNYEIDSEEYDRTANNYTVGLVLRANLFSGFGLQAKVREALANLQQAKAGLRQLELAIGVETRKAYSQAVSSFERIQVAEAAVAQADEGLRIVRNRYESGLFTIVNLLDAELALQQARIQYLRALYDHKLGLTRLHLAAGTTEEAFR
jgi:TolC family type I secretion outer membrane protein